MRTVGLIPNRDSPIARELAHRAAAWLRTQGVGVRIPTREADAAGLVEFGVTEDQFLRDVDVVVSLGGDGTMLHAASLVYPRDIPIVGINAGHLGYLTAFEAADLDVALQLLVDEQLCIASRVVVECAVWSQEGETPTTYFGINEIVLEKLGGKMVRLEASINGQAFTTYAADGVIVATPTGSTAYSLSARGPIVSPTARVMVLTPVSPHMLFDRSLVLGDDEAIEFVVTDERSVALSVDGRSVAELGAGARVRCTVAGSRISLVSPTDLGFHQILKAKFSLPDR